MIEVTDEAAVQAARLRKKEGAPENAYLRVGIKGGGCSGFAYVIRFDEKKRPDDQVIEKPDISVIVDPKSLVHLDGMTLDFTGGLNGEGLIFKNPNAKSTCGCGQSFGV